MKCSIYLWWLHAVGDKVQEKFKKMYNFTVTEYFYIVCIKKDEEQVDVEHLEKQLYIPSVFTTVETVLLNGQRIN
jgi:hypothetical protein